MQPQVQSPDIFNRLSPLGLRFWDEVTERFVGDTLRVIAARKSVWDKAITSLTQNQQPLDAFPKLPPAETCVGAPNRSGCYTFQNLPGLREVERGAGDDAFWQGPLGAASNSFVVAVDDPTGDFLPFTFEVQLPWRRLFDLDCDTYLSPPSPLSPLGPATLGIPLFSAPTRAVPSGLASLRAELWDVKRGAPASWALLHLTIADPIRGSLHGRGLADEAGRLLAAFRYPEPNEAYPLSPPYTGSPLVSQTWDVALEAYFQNVGPGAAFVEICSALGQQSASPVSLLQSVSPQVVLTKGKLEYGRELLLKSTDSPERRLLLT